MQNQIKFIFIILVSFSLWGISFEQIARGKDYTGKENSFFNIEWSSDSNYLTVEMYMDSLSSKTRKLYLIDPRSDFSLIPLVIESDKDEEGWGPTFKIAERNYGWVTTEDEYRMYAMLDETKKIRDYYIYEINETELDSEINIVYDLDPNDPIGDLVNYDLKYPIRQYSIGEKSFYFNTIAEPDRMWTFPHDITVINIDGEDRKLDEFQYGVIKYGNENKFNLNISSISVSKNENKILVVCYNENQSEVLMLTKNEHYYGEWDKTKHLNPKIEIIKKPVPEKTNYLYGLIDPNNDNRFILISREQENINQKSLDKNLAKVFVMNNNELEGDFIMYRDAEHSVIYNTPEIQFHPLNSNIYFIDDIGCNKCLKYFDINEKVVKDINLDRDNIMNFKFSPDGEFLIVSTHAPQDIYLYEIIND